jgi:hypothetical protein
MLQSTPESKRSFQPAKVQIQHLLTHERDKYSACTLCRKFCLQTFAQSMPQFRFCFLRRTSKRSSSNTNYSIYVIYADYFHYMRSLSHRHQPRGAGGVLEDKSILDGRILSGAREIRLEDVASPSTMATSITSAFEARSTI